jgi:hypothetical protein
MVGPVAQNIFRSMYLLDADLVSPGIWECRV